MIALQAQAYYVPGLPTDFCIIPPQGIHTSEGYKGNLIVNFNYEHDAKINLKEDNQGWHKAEPVERFYIKYDPKNNLKFMKLLSLTIWIRRSIH